MTVPQNRSSAVGATSTVLSKHRASWLSPPIDRICAHRNAAGGRRSSGACINQRAPAFDKRHENGVANSRTLTAQHPQRIDYEYERAGTANIFMFTEPLSGWWEATAREKKTKLDWARETARLLEGRYAACEQVILVCDNLNTHTKGAFYEAFEPARARALVRRIRFCYTPKHGSWLNIAENELSSLTWQCAAGRRMGELATLQQEITAWSADVNQTQRGVDWQMRIDDALCKLKSVYPKIKL